MANELTIRDRSHEAGALLPLAEVERMAAIVVDSGLWRGVNTIPKALSMMLLCQADGIHPMDAVRRYHFPEGQLPSMRADAMLAEFLARGNWVEWGDQSDAAVEGLFCHANGKTKVLIRWDVARAQKAGLWGKRGPWITNPQQMFRSRCITEGVRATDPGVNYGIYSEDEARDIADQDAGQGNGRFAATTTAAQQTAADRARPVNPAPIAPAAAQPVPAAAAPGATAAVPAAPSALSTEMRRFVQTARRLGLDVGSTNDPKEKQREDAASLLRAVCDWKRWTPNLTDPDCWAAGSDVAEEYAGHLANLQKAFAADAAPAAAESPKPAGVPPPETTTDGRRSESDPQLMAVRAQFAQAAALLGYNLASDKDPSKLVRVKIIALFNAINDLFRFAMDPARPADWESATRNLPAYAEWQRTKEAQAVVSGPLPAPAAAAGTCTNTAPEPSATDEDDPFEENAQPGAAGAAGVR